MKVVTVAVFAAVVAPIGAYSQSIAQIGGPAELPPSSYKGLQYVDSRGCVFMRVESSGAARWYPRVNAARKPVCNQTKPKVAVDVAEDLPAVAPKVMSEPAQVVQKTPMVQNAPMATVASKMMPPVQAKPAMMAPPVVVAAAAAAPVDVARAPSTGFEAAKATGPSKGKVGCYTSAPVAELVRLRNGGTAVMCTRGDGTTLGWRPPIYPAGSRPGIALRDADTTAVIKASAAMAAAQVKQAVPEGYRLAWKDGRLNPKRGLGTAAGQAAQDQIWTRKVPARLVSEVARKKAGTKSSVTVSTMGAAKQGHIAASYVQIGTFGVVANASGASSRLKALGLPVAQSKIVRGGKALQIVLAGPFGSDAEAQSALRRARQAGFGDAFLR